MADDVKNEDLPQKLAGEIESAEKQKESELQKALLQIEQEKKAEAKKEQEALREQEKRQEAQKKEQDKKDSAKAASSEKAKPDEKAKKQEENRKQAVKAANKESLKQQAQRQKQNPKGQRPLQPSVAEILLWLDTYDDIFSDFDPRNYEHRALSEDFLKELNKRYLEGVKGGFEVHFIIPEKQRQPHLEARIKKRLKHYFAKELHNTEREIRKHRDAGIRFLVFGLLILSLQTWAIFTYERAIWIELISVLLVPAGWFSVWNGIEKFMIQPEGLVGKREFYKKFFHCNYNFRTDEKAPA